MGIQERKQRERERRYQQILIAAKKLFIAKGFTKTTMEDIANEAELSPGTIYLYFKNKNELYASLTLRILKYLHLRLDQVKSEDSNDLAGKIDLLKDALYDVYRFDPHMISNLLQILSGNNLDQITQSLSNELNGLSKLSLKKIASIFPVHDTKADHNGYSPENLAQVVWALFSGAILFEGKQISNPEGENNLRNLLDIGFNLIYRGISSTV
jgi:AcrR family transcriptional regulator